MNPRACVTMTTYKVHNTQGQECHCPLASALAMESSRKPYPFPQLENDDNFVKGSKSGQESQNNNDQNLSGNTETLNTSTGEANTSWDRLNSVKTLSSQRHEVYHYDPVAPKDNLDLVLRCQYNHQTCFMSSKAEMILQPETVGIDCGRVLKNRPHVSEIVTLKKKELVTYNEPRRTTIDCAKGLSIESHHSEATNRGYSRKDDGGFY